MSYHVPEEEDEELNADVSQRIEKLTTKRDIDENDDDEFDLSTPSNSLKGTIQEKVLANSQNAKAEEEAIMQAVNSEFRKYG